MITTEPKIKEPSTLEMLQELEAEFPQLQESFNRLHNLYNHTIQCMEKMEQTQRELDKYTEQGDFCNKCDQLHRNAELKMDLCPQCYYELYDRGEDFEDIECEEVEEDERPY